MYWTATGAIAVNYDTGQRTPVPRELLAYVAAMDDWVSPDQLRHRHPDLGSVGDVSQLLQALGERGVLARERDVSGPQPWATWSPEAAFFHFGTRDGTYAADAASGAYDARLRTKAKRYPQPAPTKNVPGPVIALPKQQIPGSLDEALHSRRTWRQFGRQPVGLSSVAALLHQTFGVQRWGLVPGQGRVALKTSPSGGARHAIEAYVIALNVRGLRKTAFHYDCGNHQLVDLGTRLNAKRLEVAIAYQQYFLQAAVLVVMTAVFERAMWRYPYSRAYRSILTEAGHLGQTFCLAATALHLAPFCTMAFRESDLEQMLGVDGRTESAMYIVGVGSRPSNPVRQPGRIPRRRTHGRK